MIKTTYLKKFKSKFMGCFIHLGNAFKKMPMQVVQDSFLKITNGKNGKLTRTHGSMFFQKQMSMSKSSVSNAQEGTTSVLLLTSENRKDF